MALRISRMSCFRGRTPGFAGGMSGASTVHSASVKSVSYFWRIIAPRYHPLAPFRNTLLAGERGPEGHGRSGAAEQETGIGCDGEETYAQVDVVRNIGYVGVNATGDTGRAARRRDPLDRG